MWYGRLCMYRQTSAGGVTSVSERSSNVVAMQRPQHVRTSASAAVATSNMRMCAVVGGLKLPHATSTIGVRGGGTAFWHASLSNGTPLPDPEMGWLPGAVSANEGCTAAATAAAAPLAPRMSNRRLLWRITTEFGLARPGVGAVGARQQAAPAAACGGGTGTKAMQAGCTPCATRCCRLRQHVLVARRTNAH
jgi:hypothetical protein